MNQSRGRNNHSLYCHFSAAPKDLSPVSTTTSSISVRWQPIPSLYIQGYELFYWRTGFNESVRSLPVAANVSKFTIEGLESFRMYTIQVAGYVNEVGPKSEPINVTTDREGKSGKKNLMRYNMI